MSADVEWSAVRVSQDVWNVYKGEDFAGSLFRQFAADPVRVCGWIADPAEGGKRQRNIRSSAYQAARDMWGQEAGDAVC